MIKSYLKDELKRKKSEKENAKKPGPCWNIEKQSTNRKKNKISEK